MTPAMQYSHAGLLLTQGFVLAMNSTDTGLDLMDERARNAKVRADLVQRQARLPHLQNRLQVGVCEFCRRVLLTLWNTAAIRILSTRIFGSAYPLQIRRRIVRSAAVEMINSQAVKPARDECPRNQDVHIFFLTTAAALHANLPVPLVIRRAENVAFAALKRLIRTFRFSYAIDGAEPSKRGSLKPIFPFWNWAPFFELDHLAEHT